MSDIARAALSQRPRALKPARLARRDARSSSRRSCSACGRSASRRGSSTCRSSAHADLVARAERQQMRTHRRARQARRHPRSARPRAGHQRRRRLDLRRAVGDRRRGGGRRAAVRRARRLHSRRARRRSPSGSARQRRFAYVRRQVSPDEARRVAALEPRRHRLPQGEPPLLSEQGAGRAPARLRRHRQQRAERHRMRPTTRRFAASTGTVLIQTDARRHAFSRFERPPTAGLDPRADDRRVPAARRRARAARRRRSRTAPPAARAIVMNPRTGEILAMANEPTFNPNAYREFDETERRNRAVQDLYEPGSTFKIVTASAAIEEQVMPIDTLIDTSPGCIRIGDERRRRISATQLRRAVVHRRDRQVEQRRRDQDRLPGRDRAAEPVRAALRVRPAACRRISRREPGHRLGAGEVDRQRAGVGVDGLSGRRDAAADGRRPSARSPTAASSSSRASSRAVYRDNRRLRRHSRRSCGARSAPTPPRR